MGDAKKPKRRSCTTIKTESGFGTFEHFSSFFHSRPSSSRAKHSSRSPGNKQLLFATNATRCRGVQNVTDVWKTLHTIKRVLFPTVKSRSNALTTVNWTVLGPAAKPFRLRKRISDSGSETRSRVFTVHTRVSTSGDFIALISR